MADIFLSYASEDIDKAQRLAQALTAHGSVFWDRTIPAGKTWREFISFELERALYGFLRHDVKERQRTLSYLSHHGFTNSVTSNSPAQPLIEKLAGTLPGGRCH